MSGRNAPLSPISVSGGTDWTLAPNDNDGPYPKNRGLPISPPNSGGSVEAMNGGYPPGPRSVGGPSPPPSVGRSSTATNLYARSESGRRNTIDEATQDAVLGEHYVSLKRFLSATSRDGKPTPPPNKARDKLQRLTSVQFLELSTDVYDELKRREAVGRRPPNAPPNSGPPAFLEPQSNFHPKRNQARQKLSSLGPPRFRDLATDVFCELERRIPRLTAGDIPRMGSPMSMRQGPPSRTGTPVNGYARRRPSEASSVRSGRGGPPPMNGGYPVPPSPGLPPGDFGRPMPKQFQSNTIVPNKSTMVEEDDDPISPTSPNGDADPYPMSSIDRQSKRSERSESDKKLIEDYESQVRDLREKLEAMEDNLKKKDDELVSVLDAERARATAANMEKQEFGNSRLILENRLAETENLNRTLQDDLARMQDQHANEVRQLRDQIEDARQASMNARDVAPAADPELQRENEDLRIALQEQQQVTDEVRREAQEFLREMRVLSQQSSSAWEKQLELEKTIESLETEVRDWRNRYARTKTQLRNMRASSMGLTIDQDAAKYLREKGFTQDNGLVKDVHVTKFQIAIDELLQRARVEDPEKVMDSMKAVVLSVRRITKDIDGSISNDEATAQQQAKLKARVSSTANNLITASKNFAHAAGLSPVSLLDAAASHLVSAVVELLRTVKIRATPAGELEDDDDGTMTPVDSTGFFSPRSTTQQSNISSAISTQESLPPPPPFQGLGGSRASADSSAYSPISSPRESYASKPYGNGNGTSNGGYMGLNRVLANTTNGNMNGNMNGMNGNANRSNGADMRQRTFELKDYLEDQTAVLIQNIQNLVGLIRDESPFEQVSPEINAIIELVEEAVGRTQALGPDAAQLVERLESGRQRLMEAADRGRDIYEDGIDTKSREWRMWSSTLPPIAFEIARETKELVQRVDKLVMIDGADDFA